MKPDIVLTCVALAALGCATLSLGSQPNASQSDAPDLPITIELRPEATVRLPLADAEVQLADSDGEPQHVPVVLEKTEHDVEIHLAGREPWTGRIACYELRSEDPQLSYAWSFWSTWPLGDVQLQADDAGRTYLVSVVRTAVMMFEIGDQPRDRISALTDLFTGADRARMAALHILEVLPREPFLYGVSALEDAYRVTVQSITRQEDDEWVVRLSGPSSDEVFTLVGGPWVWRHE